MPTWLFGSLGHRDGCNQRVDEGSIRGRNQYGVDGAYMRHIHGKSDRICHCMENVWDRIGDKWI